MYNYIIATIKYAVSVKPYYQQYSIIYHTTIPPEYLS